MADDFQDVSGEGELLDQTDIDALMRASMLHYRGSSVPVL